MQLANSTNTESKSETNEPTNDIIEIRYVPLPAEQVEAYRVAMRILAKLLIEIVEEERLHLDVLPKERCLEVSGSNDQVTTVKDAACR